MGNATRGIVTVTDADGTPFKLQFSANAMCEIEDAKKCGILQFVGQMEKAGDGVLMTDLRLLVWAALQEHHEGATVRDAGRLITAMGGLGPAVEVIAAMVSAAFPDASEGEAGNGTAAAVK